MVAAFTYCFDLGHLYIVLEEDVTLTHDSSTDRVCLRVLGEITSRLWGTVSKWFLYTKYVDTVDR
jgi:hypothetical protein